MDLDNRAQVGKDNVQATLKLRGYKTVCAKLGLSMCVFFICRLIAGLIAHFLAGAPDDINRTMLSLLYYIVIIICTYIIPLAFTVIIFNYHRSLRTLYKKPRRVARALGTFPAAYGLGYGIALLTLLASFILSKTLGGETHIEQLLRPPIVESASNVTEVIMMMVLMVVAAPLFEEYWVRGIMFDVLRPYGTGMAILISSILFGLMHGSLYMLFYTTALGLALGYIRYATGSLYTVTILHALINAVSATTLLLQSLVEFTNEQNRGINTISMIYMVFMLVLIVVGIVVFFTKIPTIKKYRFENPWTGIRPVRKIVMFLFSVPVIIMLVFAFNELSGQMLFNIVMR